uniref:TAFA chemokine like family member 5 n=1 Tax=Anolis carolinensis TaxID=28377 RepID=A0A803SX62_ANOCA
MLAGWRELSTGISAVLCCLLFFWLLYSHPTKEGKELEVGTCEITALDRDMSHPKRMIARQTARCSCRRGQVAGTTKAKPACVDGTPCVPISAGTTRCRAILKKWGYKVESTTCECREKQTTDHLLQCSLSPATCTMENLLIATPETLQVVKGYLA